MKRDSLASQVVLITLAICLASLAMVAGCSCGQTKTNDVKNPVTVRPAEDAETHKYRTGDVTEEDLQVAEHKGYADGLRDGKEWLRNNPNPSLILSVKYPEDHAGYRQYEEIIAYNEGYLAGYQKAMEYKSNPL